MEDLNTQIEVSCTCKGHPHVYSTYTRRKVGDKYRCPKTGKPVVVVDVSETHSATIANPNNDAGNRPPLILAVGLLIVPLLCLWLFSLVVKAFTFLVYFLGSAIQVGATILPSLGISMLLLVAMIAGYSLLYSLLHQPIKRLEDTYLKLERDGLINRPPNGSDDNEHLLDDLLAGRPRPDARHAIRDLAEQSRRTVLTQQLIIGVLIIGMAIGQLVCYLSIETIEDARRVFRQSLQLGVPALIIFGILFYGGTFFFDLDKNLRNFGGFWRKIGLCVILGISTTFTLIIVPLLLDENAFSAQSIAINIVINVIGSVFIILYGKIIKLCT
jgi:hypothetical protein